MRPTDKDLFLRALRDVGGRASNGSLQTKLGWDTAKYWNVHSALYEDNRIEKGRGYGGTAILLDEPDQITPPGSSTAGPSDQIKPSNLQSPNVLMPPSPLGEYPRELDLYEPAKRQLDQNWETRKQLDSCHCEITALQGRRETGGSWSRPDLVVIAYRKYEFLPEKVFELFSFEVKPATDVSIKGVMEALAHREAATRSFVIYHTANQDFRAFPEADRIEELAARHGVGVYAALDINDFNQWAEIVPAQRASPDPESIDTFIRRTMSDTAKTKLRKWF